MLKRKIYDRLRDWKEGHGKECLLVKGARQVGKTYVIREFGKTEYKSFIEINFLQHPELKSIFDGSLEADDIYKRMSASLPGINLIVGDTLVFLDEIQKCANARTSLKFLAEDGRYDVIASGSLLGLHYGWDDDVEVMQVGSLPVGYERQMEMYSLDFEEFLWAYGYNEAILYLKEYFDDECAVPSEINEQYEVLFREYAVVGGMPEVVADFSVNKDFTRVQSVQEKILAVYDDDIVSHARGSEKVKVKACYDSVPRQLAREYKKFKYSEVEKKATSRKYGDSIEWLRDSAIVNICNNVYEPYLPLLGNCKETEYKVYFNDTGLLMARYGVETKLAMLNNTIKGSAKGGIYENLIAEVFVKNGYRLFYYKTESSTMELEFLLERGGEVVPVEVKAGNHGSISLNSFMERFSPKVAYKFIDGNVGRVAGKLSLPHYMAVFL